MNTIGSLADTLMTITLQHTTIIAPYLSYCYTSCETYTWVSRVHKYTISLRSAYWPYYYWAFHVFLARIAQSTLSQLLDMYTFFRQLFADCTRAYDWLN